MNNILLKSLTEVLSYEAVPRMFWNLSREGEGVLSIFDILYPYLFIHSGKQYFTKKKLALSFQTSLIHWDSALPV